MPQSHIFLTQTCLDRQQLIKLLAYNFGTRGASIKVSHLEINLDQETLEKSWNQLKAAGTVLNPELSEKKDFTEALLDFYQTYSENAFLFLGDLSQYSLPMQEGMLKLLEEPPQNLQIILFAQDRSDILPTITSRCQFHQLPKEVILKLLDQKMLEKTKSKLPVVADWIKKYLNKQAEDLPDLKNVEREELDFWLWQVQSYSEQYYQKQPSLRFAKALFQIIEARKLNRQNLQKKFVLGWLG